MTKVRNIVILGSGPAGLTAAIYASRALLEPVVVEGSQAGGQLMTTNEVENFPGFPEPITGPDLIKLMREQAERFGAEFIQDDASEVNLNRTGPFTVTVGENEIQTHTIIIATGASAKYLGLESEKKLIGKGVSACATCDGFFFKNKKVAVVGGGDTAMEESLFLTRFASSVTVIHRRDKLRASKIMQERALKNPKISFLWNSVVEDIRDVDKNKVEGLILRNVLSGERTEFPCDGLFVAIGHKPNTEIFKNKLDMDDAGYIKTKTGTTLTSVEGVFAAGDVQDKKYRQAVTAAASGCMAALDAQKYLLEKGIVS